jgi:hypothetical protein
MSTDEGGPGSRHGAPGSSMAWSFVFLIWPDPSRNWDEHWTSSASHKGWAAGPETNVYSCSSAGRAENYWSLERSMSVKVVSILH